MFNSALIYEGRSPVDDAPIMAIATGGRSKSTNAKTGPMVQIWILRSDIAPLDALTNGSDASICGDCSLRGGVCYVTVFQAPNRIYDAYTRGRYPRMTPADVGSQCANANVSVRVGAYGDPGTLPFEVVEALLRPVKTHTSYTHMWTMPHFDPRHLRYSMASVDGSDTHNIETLRARYPIARYYRITDDKTQLMSNEIVCPHKDASGVVRVQCADCGLCAGTGLDAKNIVELSSKKLNGGTR